jgi:hypothetical protein
LDTLPRKKIPWSTGFSNMEDAFIFSKQHDPPKDLSLPDDSFENLEYEEGDIE